jgi:hypothetical protein
MISQKGCLNFSKAALVFTALFFTIASTSTYSWECKYSTLSNGLVAYYPFNGDFNDSVGYLAPASNYGAFFTYDRFGNSNGAIGFSGSQYAIISGLGSILSGSQTGVTVTAWYYINKSHLGFNSGFIQNPQNQAAPAIRISVGGPPDYVISGDLGGWGGYQGAYDVTTSTPFPVGSWHQITAVIPVGSLPLYFLDGVACTWGNPLPQNPTVPLNFNCNYCVGTSWEVNKAMLLPGYLMNGAISNLRFYNRALSSNEISALYTLEATPSREDLTNGLVAWYYGGSTNDQSGNGNNLKSVEVTLTNGINGEANSAFFLMDQVPI